LFLVRIQPHASCDDWRNLDDEHQWNEAREKDKDASFDGSRMVGLDLIRY
jgi:hypothetical protein